MRIDSLEIHNFRALTKVRLSDLQNTVVIAGPNGCGKSCIFDAIRLLKSVYGGYQPNEWHQWFGEFKINVNQLAASWLTLFQNRGLPLLIRAEFSLSPEELAYLRTEAQNILRQRAWEQIAPAGARQSAISASIAADLRVHAPRVERMVEDTLPTFLAALDQAKHVGAVHVSPSAQVTLEPSQLLEIVFGLYDPQHLGIIDYHGASRNYVREQLGGVNLNIEDSSENRLRQHALYNYTSKYANLKSEMAGSYVRQLLAREADRNNTVESLDETLKELFSTFFPGKKFLGPQPTADGRLSFPVQTPNGSEHDIDELSSGEKEVLYGYLRLRNSAPRSSVLLIDEPELHLNPRLMAGLASFYHQHLGLPLGTQLWLVTHSDTLIREAVGQAGFSVFHLHPPGQYDGEQATPVTAQKDLERVIIGLVGDLAAYRPGAKIVVFEGGTDSATDVRIVCTLFPRFQEKTNPISGGNKARVAQLYTLLESAREAGHLPAKFYSVTDSDGDFAGASVPRRFSWDVYHIENYLLEPNYIHKSLIDLNKAEGELSSPASVLQVLKACAGQTINDLVAHRLRVAANTRLLACVDLGFDPARDDVGNAISEALSRSNERITQVINNELGIGALGRLEADFRRDLETALSGDGWISLFRGRDVLKRFVGNYVPGVAYEPFRDLIISKMRDGKYEPPGMRSVIDAILTD